MNKNWVFITENYTLIHFSSGNNLFSTLNEISMTLRVLVVKTNK